MGWGIAMRVEQAKQARGPQGSRLMGRLQLRTLPLRAHLTLLFLGISLVCVLFECALLSATLSRRVASLPPEMSHTVSKALFGAGAGPGEGSLRLLFMEASLIPLLLTVLLSGILATLVARQYTQPLKHAAEALERLAGGDLSARPPLDTRSSELAGLTRNVSYLGAQLEGADAERRYANAAIAHELRTPIAVLRARLSALRDGVLEVNDFELAKLQGQLEGLARLADDLQTVTQAEARVMSLEWDDCNLAGVMVQTVEELTAAGASLKLDLGAPFLWIQGDAGRLRQALFNVLENALRFSPTGQQVQVSLVVSREWAVLKVSDAGSGVTSHELPRLFDRYYRGDASRTRATGGSGMGLAIVKAIVEAHGGHVGARPSTLGGLEITLEFPLALVKLMR